MTIENAEHLRRDGPSLLVGYDGSTGAQHALAAAGHLLPGRMALVVYVWPGPNPIHVHTSHVRRDRDELVEEVHVAARHEARVVAEDGVSLARHAGLDAIAETVETHFEPAEALRRIATDRSVAAVVVGRGTSSHPPRRPIGKTARALARDCPVPVIIV